MSTSADDLIKTMESDAVKFLSQKLVQGLGARFGLWVSTGLIGGVLTQGISVVIGLGILYGDWLSYMLVSNWQASREADHYEKAVDKATSLPATATKKEKADAEKAQNDAFDRLVNLGTYT